RNEDPARIDAMQIDRLRQAKKGLRPMARRKITAAGHEITLDGKDEALGLESRRRGKSRLKLLAAAVSRHGECTRQFESIRRAAALQRDADYLALDAAPGGSLRMRPVSRAQHDQSSHSLG